MERQESWEPSSQDSSEEVTEVTASDARVVPDAIHQRFLETATQYYKCKDCDSIFIKKKQLIKHLYDTMSNSPYHRAVDHCRETTCKGPIFHYEISKKRKFYHHCKDWKKFLKSRQTTASDLSITSSNCTEVSNTASSINLHSSFQETEIHPRPRDTTNSLENEKYKSSALSSIFNAVLLGSPNHSSAVCESTTFGLPDMPTSTYYDIDTVDKNTDEKCLEDTLKD